MSNPKASDSKLEYGIAPLLPSAAEQRAARLASGHIVIVTGGRDYSDRELAFAALDRAHAHRAITLVVHGACFDRATGELLGADRWANEWERERGIAVEGHPIDALTWGSAAESMRRRQMANAGAHGCIAFPGHAGTAHMVRQARQAGHPRLETSQGGLGRWPRVSGPPGATRPAHRTGYIAALESCARARSFSRASDMWL